jgi:hypothetical protein
VDLVRALPGAVPPGSLDLDSPDRATATTVELDLRPEPSLTTVLAPSTPSEVAAGATVDLCVTVTDEVGDPARGVDVTFQLDGPGSPATAEATTVDNGVACVDWTSADDLEDPAELQVRVTATRDEVTSPEATAALTVQPGAPAPPEDPDEPEPVHVVPGFTGTLEQSSGGSTRLGADGRTTIRTSYSSSTSVTVSRDEVARAQAGEVVPIAVLTRYDRVEDTFGDYGLPGTTERCVVTTLESRTITGATGTLRRIRGSDALRIDTEVTTTSTNASSVSGPVHPQCWDPDRRPEREMTSTTVSDPRAVQLFVSPVRDTAGRIVGWSPVGTGGVLEPV